MEKGIDLNSKPQDAIHKAIVEPLQENISTQESKDTKKEKQLNVWIPESMMKRLKMKGIETNKSLKEMVTEALERFI